MIRTQCGIGTNIMVVVVVAVVVVVGVVTIIGPGPPGRRTPNALDIRVGGIGGICGIGGSWDSERM